MIYLDDFTYPCDQTGDGGDSAVRAGILKFAKSSTRFDFNLFDYQPSPGIFTRHPKQYPWNNVNNCTWDQQIMLLAGFKALGASSPAYEGFTQATKRFFFAQNFERDIPGSTKYPFKHSFINDQGESETRLFDLADPLFLPNRIGAMVIAGQITSMYWFLPLAYLFHLASVKGHSFSEHNEENQMIAECYIYGSLEYFRNTNPNWEAKSLKYWSERNEVEYHYLLKELVEN